MAIKKEIEFAETAKTEQHIEPVNVAKKDFTEQKEEVIRLAYIGPNLPDGQLKCNRIFVGTEKEIKKRLKGTLEKYPLIEKMLVPVEKMGEKKEKVKAEGNILHKYYVDILSSIVANRKKEI